MLLSDGSRMGRLAASAFSLFALAVAAGCQVQPLYNASTSPTVGALTPVSVSPAENRVEQRVRNELVYLLGGGAGEASNAPYQLELKVRSRDMDVLVSSSDDVARAGRVIMTADYNLARRESGETVRSGRRQVVSLVDFPVQEFAKIRAIRDAENRAARELAELLRLDITSAIAKR